MASKVKVKIKMPVINELKTIFRGNGSKILGAALKIDIIEHMTKGLSPVKGWGRFQAYKAQAKITNATNAAKSLTGDRRKAGRERVKTITEEVKKKGYPYSVMDEHPDKKVRPVNLKLTGDMQRAIDYRPHNTGIGMTIGIFDQEELKKAETHNEGTNKNVPQRKFLPTAKGEEFTPTIMRTIKEVVRDIVGSIIEKSNKK